MTSSPSDSLTAEKAYEPDTARVRGFVIAIIGLVITVALLLVAVRVFLSRADSESRAVDARDSIVQDKQVPAGPQLQPSLSNDRKPEEDLAKMRREEDDVFAQMGWSKTEGHEPRVPDAIVAGLAARQHKESAR